MFYLCFTYGITHPILLCGLLDRRKVSSDTFSENAVPKRDNYRPSVVKYEVVYYILEHRAQDR